MFLVTKGVGGNSAKYFIKQQQSLGEEEGFIQEMISGQKVVKVFCHEDESIEKFNAKNDQLCSDATSAHTFANILMPIMGNLSYMHYALTAVFGAILYLYGLVPGLGTIVSFSRCTSASTTPTAMAAKMPSMIRINQ